MSIFREYAGDEVMVECLYQLIVGIPDLTDYRPGSIKDAMVACAADFRDTGISGLPSGTFVMNWWEANKQDYA